MKRKVSPVLALSFIVSMFIFVIPAAFSNIPVIPAIETWQEIHFGQDLNRNTKDKKALYSLYYIRWYQDPSRVDHKGMVAYYRTPTGDIPFVKAWDFREVQNNGYDFTETFTALLLDDGTWVIGDKGERLEMLRPVYNDKGEVISVEFYFNRQNSSISRKIHPQ